MFLYFSLSFDMWSAMLCVIVKLLVNFYCDRLKDHYSVLPHAMSGLLALVRSNISCTSIVWYYPRKSLERPQYIAHCYCSMHLPFNSTLLLVGHPGGRGWYCSVALIFFIWLFLVQWWTTWDELHHMLLYTLFHLCSLPSHIVIPLTCLFVVCFPGVKPVDVQHSGGRSCAVLVSTCSCSGIFLYLWGQFFIFQGNEL